MSPQVLYSYACDPGRSLTSVKGTVWIKVKSEEISGQFLAHALVSHSEQLKLEVVNFLGGTEALILVDKGRFEVVSPNTNTIQNRTANGYWAGVPLRWAPYLFLGRIPCPTSSKHLRMSVDSDGQLEIISFERDQKKAEKFTFKFREMNGKPWPYYLTWESLENGKASNKDSTMNAVEFSFYDPEDNSLSPTQWEAKSSLGTVRVRWRKRDASG